MQRKRRVPRARITTNDGGAVAGYARNGLIAYPEPDGTWTVEDGLPDVAPDAPKIEAQGLTREEAKEILRG